MYHSRGKRFFDQVVDVMRENVFVDRVIAEGATDKEDARSTDELPEREEVHVDAAGRVIRG